MKVGHRQAPNKRKPDSKESGFFASGAIHITCPIHPPGRLGRAERNPTRVSELQVSKGKVELRGCLVQSHPQQQNVVGGTSVPNLDQNKHING